MTTRRVVVSQLRDCDPAPLDVKNNDIACLILRTKKDLVSHPYRFPSLFGAQVLDIRGSRKQNIAVRTWSSFERPNTRTPALLYNSEDKHDIVGCGDVPCKSKCEKKGMRGGADRVR
jgi:hypothetical protein